MRLFRMVVTLCVLLACPSLKALSEITVYTYNDRPPFIVDKDKKVGLEYRLCDWLTRESGAYKFTLKVVTAGEAKALVEKDELKGILLGVNKVWFPEPVRNRNLWTLPVLWDRNLVISLGKGKVEYTGPGSLEGLKLAGVKGFAYPAITEAISSGKITRMDNASEILALEMVAAKKADVTIVSEWTFMYARLRGDLDGDFYESNKPFLEFERSILVPPAMKALLDHLNGLLTNVRKNAGWQEATSL